MSQLKRLAKPPSGIKAAGRVVRNTYAVTVANTGTEPIRALKVSGRTFGGQKIAKVGRGCRFSGTAVRCTIAELAPKSKVRLVFTVKPAKAGTPARTRGLKLTVGTVNLTLTAGKR
nr:hypothetical protein GCM10020093_076560 [Planobispora longispora]